MNNQLKVKVFSLDDGGTSSLDPNTYILKIIWQLLKLGKIGCSYELNEILVPMVDLFLIIIKML